MEPIMINKFSKEQVDFSETWLGFTYNHLAKVWTWTNNCTWMHFPAFWRECWNVDCDGKFSTNDYYAKYSKLPKPGYAYGVEPVLKTTKIMLDIVCYTVRTLWKLN